jgi:hypothetical protein
MLRPTVSRPVYLGVKPHLGPKIRFLLLSDSCGFVHVGAPSLTRRRVCRLQLLLTLASAVILKAVKISSTYHLCLQFYMSAFYIVVKMAVPCGHILFTVLHVTLVYANWSWS